VVRFDKREQKSKQGHWKLNNESFILKALHIFEEIWFNATGKNRRRNTFELNRSWHVYIFTCDPVFYQNLNPDTQLIIIISFHCSISTYHISQWSSSSSQFLFDFDSWFPKILGSCDPDPKAKILIQYLSQILIPQESWSLIHVTTLN